jgi:hypothetical protein
MKKVLVVLLMILVGTSAQASAANISIPDTDATEGATIEVPVAVDGAKGTAGFQFTVSYDASALQATGATAGDLTSGWMVTPNTNETGQMKVAGVDTTLTGLQGGNGSIVKLQFKALGKPGAKSTLRFTTCKLSDSMGNKMASSCKEGQIKIKGGGKGKTK